jgi:dTDP-glucose pyrophosphorylase
MIDGSLLRDVIECMNNNGCGAALVVDKSFHLLDVLTDGDLRRAMLAGKGPETSVDELRDRRVGSPYPRPVTAPADADKGTILRLMKARTVRFVPLVDGRGRVRRVALLDDLRPDERPPLRALVMAGGFGRRMSPLTKKLPKPMLPVEGKPVLEHILRGLRAAGIRRVSLATHYKAGVISRHFRDGRKLGIRIDYLEENSPRGTAGALRRLTGRKDPLLVINGDILTRVDFRAMLDFHRENKAEMTVGVRAYDVRIPFGVVESSGARVTGISEKPVLKHFINAGIYLINPGAFRFVRKEGSSDMPDLIARLVAKGRRVVSFPIHESWMDMGTREDYVRAQGFFGQERKK